MRVEPGSPLVGMTLQEARARVPDAIFVAVLRNGQTLSPPAPDLGLQSGDEVAAIGTEAHLRRLEDYSLDPDKDLAAEPLRTDRG